eukprot:m.96335 g.96335  ORF g.96335 m.96335 type:complete len:458 (+) comp16649_c0_seq1:90-1463(+)
MTGTATLKRAEKDQIAARAAKSGSAGAAVGMDVDEESIEEEFDNFDKLAVTNLDDAIAQYKAVVSEENTDTTKVRRKEIAFTRAAVLLKNESRTQDMKEFIGLVRPFMADISKAKGAKLFRSMLEHFLDIDNAVHEQVAVCTECIEWTKQTKRRFLRQALEIVLTDLHVKARQYQEALGVAQPLIRELKRLDDKMQLVEVQLMESRAYYSLSNYPKSRAALVSARTTANGVYCPPKMQAGLDLMSGIVHAQEQDFKTAFSYFYESFEGYDSTDSAKNAVSALKYMLLCKIMLGEADAVPSIIAGKLALKHSTGPDARVLEAMRMVAVANLHRSLAEFEQAFKDFKAELEDDVIIMSHVQQMYDDMLQSNLCRLVEPFSCVEIAHVAALIKLGSDVVETKLSQMILDKKLNGILDQGAGTLEIFESGDEDKAYAGALDTIQHTSHVVEALFAKAQKLF